MQNVKYSSIILSPAFTDLKVEKCNEGSERNKVGLLRVWDQNIRNSTSPSAPFEQLQQ